LFSIGHLLEIDVRALTLGITGPMGFILCQFC
jgi:hypothetical protein